VNQSHRLFRRFAVAAVVVAGAIPLTDCGKDSSGPGATSIANFVSNVSVQGTALTGLLKQGSAPAAGSGPSVTPVGPSIVINGGSAQVELTGSASFTTVILAVEGQPGYYEITLPSSQTVVDLILTLAQAIPSASFNLRYSVGASSSALGAYAASPTTVTQVASGDVQVSVSWDVNSDVDLHVVEPSGEEIWYGDRTSATGGVLNLDSNAGCSLVNAVRNENITWPTSAPPTGTYTVRVDYWSACTLVQTNYVVTVQVKGQSPQVFTGTFTGPGDQGVAGSGTLITTFTK